MTHRSVCYTPRAGEIVIAQVFGPHAAEATLTGCGLSFVRGEVRADSASFSAVADHDTTAGTITLSARPPFAWHITKTEALGMGRVEEEGT